jgi:hypothetical protein
MFLIKEIKRSIYQNKDASVNKTVHTWYKNAASITLFLTRRKLEFCFHQINPILKDFYSGGA